MLRFAYWVGLGGAICALALALSACAHGSFASHETPYLVLFFSVFVTFGPAVMAHPARTGFGGRYRVDSHALSVAAPWTIAFVAVVTLAFLANLLLLSGPDHYSLDAASLAGRVDRQLTASLFLAMFHASALCIASSGLRWGLAPASPVSWFGRWLNPPLGHAAPLGLPGEPFTYRTATRSWSVIALEVAGAIAVIVLSHSEVEQALQLPYANLLPLLLLVVPSWHVFLKTCGRITFRVEEGCLLSRHFPFTSRNRRVPIVDLRGIQVNGELNDEGVVTHYSLLLVRDHCSTDRLIDKLPSAEYARDLAAQIDSWIRLSKTGTR